jgi:mannose-6-phosphate isomerase-like protein (cupin superfamily)
MNLSENTLLRMPGAILMTRLKVYDTVTPDGQRGGTPHVHLLCTEMYFVLSGSGFVELIDTHGFSRVELKPYSALLFSPGTVHRLINPNSDLELLAIMANSGLPERGDNVVCFTSEWLADQARYDAAMWVGSVTDAYQRRDRGVLGFLELKAAFELGPENGRMALKQFYQSAAERTGIRQTQWGQIVADGSQKEVEQTQQQLQLLADGCVDYLMTAQHHLIQLNDHSTLGFCGHLDLYFDPATLALEGIKQL